METDRIVDEVIEKFKQRSELGIRKYGTTLEKNRHDDFLTHAQEEAMDFVLYLQKIKDVITEENKDTLEEYKKYDVKVIYKAILLSGESKTKAEYICSLLDEATSRLAKYSPRSPYTLLNDMCRIANIKIDDIRSDARSSTLVDYRCVYILLAKDLFPYISNSEITRQLNMDHSSIYYYFRNMKLERQKLYEEMKELLNC